MYRNRTRNSYRPVALAACIIASMSAVTADARPLPIVVHVSAQTLAAMSSATKACVYVTYDKNGNRLTQSAATVTTAQTTWGSGTYGCFDWKS